MWWRRAYRNSHLFILKKRYFIEHYKTIKLYNIESKSKKSKSRVGSTLTSVELLFYDLAFYFCRKKSRDLDTGLSRLIMVWASLIHSLSETRTDGLTRWNLRYFTFGLDIALTSVWLYQECWILSIPKDFFRFRVSSMNMSIVWSDFKSL